MCMSAQVSFIAGVFLVTGGAAITGIALLQYAYISFFCLLAGLATLHLVYIILSNKCAEECSDLFPQ